jgi:stress response protein SCP2
MSQTVSLLQQVQQLKAESDSKHQQLLKIEADIRSIVGLVNSSFGSDAGGLATLLTRAANSANNAALEIYQINNQSEHYLIEVQR